MAQVMSHNFKSPLIGTFFTKAAHRNRGYGKSILIQLTNQLISKGHKKVRLMADVGNAASINVFENAGYEIIYKHILVGLPEIEEQDQY